LLKESKIAKYIVEKENKTQNKYILQHGVHNK